jgi:3-dehydro-L-gulonate 2-dehydrogenase
VLDAVLVALSGGRSVAEVTAGGYDGGNSQLFICIRPNELHADLIEQAIEFAKDSDTVEGGRIRYPGESTLAARRRSEAEGVEVNEQAWRKLLAL